MAATNEISELYRYVDALQREKDDLQCKYDSLAEVNGTITDIARGHKIAIGYLKEYTKGGLPESETARLLSQTNDSEHYHFVLGKIAQLEDDCSHFAQLRGTWWYKISKWFGFI